MMLMGSEVGHRNVSLPSVLIRYHPLPPMTIGVDFYSTDLRDGSEYTFEICCLNRPVCTGSVTTAGVVSSAITTTVGFAASAASTVAGVTSSAVITTADGKKMGKSASGAVWVQGTGISLAKNQVSATLQQPAFWKY